MGQCLANATTNALHSNVWMLKNKMRRNRSSTIGEFATNNSSGLPVTETQESAGVFDSFVSAIRGGLLSKEYIAYGKAYCDLPCREVAPITTEVLAADTGPEGGLQCLSVENKKQFNRFHYDCPVTREPIAGVLDWNKSHHKAYGLSQSLYELDPKTKTFCGEPNADAFAIVARENNAFIVVADGVNWGEKAFMASRSAIKGCVGYLSEHLHHAANTQDVFQCILRSFQHAHSCILECDATLTTLTAAVVCKLQGINCHALCVVNVGDSLCYVYRKGKSVQEVTIGSHKNDEERDMRSSGGCLGPSDGSNPDLTNLTCSFTFVEDGDIVFLTSDGISDNFDPVVLKKSKRDVHEVIGSFKSNQSTEDEFGGKSVNYSNNHTKPTIKQELKRKRSLSAPPVPDKIFEPNNEIRRQFANELMKQVIENSETPSDGERSAKELCANLITFAIKETSKKRGILENGNIDPQQRYKESKTQPGKLDHSTVAAFEVGRFCAEPLTLTSRELPNLYNQPISNDITSLLGYIGYK